MALSEIFAAIEESTIANMAALSLDPPVFKVGEAALSEQDSPPRVVFVPGEETITHAEGLGGDCVPNIRPLFTRNSSVDIHIWHEDIGKVESLINHITAAIHDLIFGADRMLRGTWRQRQADITKLGVVYTLTLEIKIPIVRETEVTVVVETLPITPELDIPS